MTYIITEIGQAHDGSLGLLHSYIEALAETGVDAIKFQTHIADAESSCHEPFRIEFSYEDKTRFDYWKRMEFSLAQWIDIRRHCQDCNLEFISSPFSMAAVDLLEETGIRTYKIGSGETTNFPMLEKIASTGKNIIISSGMSSFQELDETINFLKPFGNKVSILQCTTKYPTHAEDVGLNVISELKQHYDLPVGLSDHSGSIFPCLSAVSLGAELIEFHVTFDRQMFGPDSKSSLTPKEIKTLVSGTRYIQTMLNSKIDKNEIIDFQGLKSMFGKSLAVNKELKSGHSLTFDDLETKKPAGHGINVKEYKKVIGKKLTRSLRKWDFLTKDDFSE